MAKKLDLTGKKFGSLTAIEAVGLNETKHVLWKFKCDCGKESIHAGYRVRHGDIVSCGCSRRSKDRVLSALKQQYTAYRYSAKARGLSFDLTFDEFVEISQKPCMYCGSPPIERTRKNFTCLFNGVDRLISDRDYATNNCVPCCETCNIRKGDMDVRDFFRWVYKVHDHLKSTPLM